ncbi:nucleotidyltransferase family protein [Erythrobacter insulae]|uniref:Nucleotidyltransferase family protein n=1 Tax=Erythrobacter insulae TaxID=2584124 RepID=A0A547PCV8_9SPHN|nr:nucleotidyltransferase family protein [Erythrobacter insulae]TRD11971.1 nucleotidyltransferase family protein [Erythrobacter insulae]
MMAGERRLGAALLAAGSSHRFGDDDKLTADFCGMPLGVHTACALPLSLFTHAWAITANAEHPCAHGWREAGFDVHVNPKAETGMGSSVALAASMAMAAQLDGLMIALADMPFVPERHFAALVNAAKDIGPQCIATSAVADTRMPPAIFGSDQFGSLARSSGDSGARGILSKGQVLACSPDWLTDIDTPEALVTARNRIKGR